MNTETSQQPLREQDSPSQTEEQLQAPEEEVQEVSPLEMIEMLSTDLTTALTALKRIARINPATAPGGVSNQNFGKRYQQGLEKAQKLALDAVLEIKEER